MKEFYKLAYRQSQGFIESLIRLMGVSLEVPDYTTMSRRAGKLEISLRIRSLIKQGREGIIVAIDSTGLSLYFSGEWNRLKHKKKVPGYEKWRKLHVAINVESGEILDNKYTKSTVNDCEELPGILEGIEEDIRAVCGDMAYDNVNSRKAIMQREAKQLIPPIRKARVASKNRNRKKADREILQERDDAINYINYNSINGDKSLARKSWKEKSGYHARSLVETTMWQIKSHCRDRLTNKREDSRATQAKIKCKLVNLINALIGILSILPMHQANYWKSLRFFKLVKNVPAREVVAKLPIHGEWKGVNKSGVLLIGRKGEIFNWNPYCRVGGAGNYNVCVMAPSGSGKSFFLEELATSLIAQDVTVFVLDIGGSYHNISEGMERSEYIRFNAEICYEEKE